MAAWFSEMGVGKADSCINAKRPRVHLDGLPLVAAVPGARSAKARSLTKLFSQILHFARNCNVFSRPILMCYVVTLTDQWVNCCVDCLFDLVSLCRVVVHS